MPEGGGGKTDGDGIVTFAGGWKIGGICIGIDALGGGWKLIIVWGDVCTG